MATINGVEHASPRARLHREPIGIADVRPNQPLLQARHRRTIATRDADGRPRNDRATSAAASCRSRAAHVTPGAAHGHAGRAARNITARYLGDPTQFWRVCDANDVLDPTSSPTSSARSIAHPHAADPGTIAAREPPRDPPRALDREDRCRLPAPHDVLDALQRVEVTNDRDSGDGFQITFTLAPEASPTTRSCESARSTPFNRVVIASSSASIPRC